MNETENNKPTADTLLGDTLDARPQGQAERPAPPPSPTDLVSRRARIESAVEDFSALPQVDPDSYVPGYEVARGGMGRITAARDRRLGRKVALKELIDRSEDRVRRFEREALVTARLQHPAIVGVYEAGRWPSSEPFYAMKLVSGRSLGEVLDRELDLGDRLALLPNLIAVVEALAYAHEQRIIHRDLKPSNILLGEFGETVVIDWGLAKVMGEEEPEPAEDRGGAAAKEADPGGDLSADLTVAGSIVGTPAYMAPEQAAGKPLDERADVYALGAILYHLLGGQPAHRGESAERILEDVLEREPAPLGDIQPEVAQDLQAIVAKAMAREPGARYRSAKELAEDLIRFRRGKLVAAHSYTARALFFRWLGRHRAAVAVAVAAAVLLAVVGALSVRSIVGERDRAEAARARAAARADELLLAQARSQLEENPREALRWLAKLPDTASDESWRVARAIATEALARGVPRVLSAHEDRIWIAASDSGEAIASGGEDGRVVLWDPATGEKRELGAHEGGVTDLSFSPDGETLATGGMDNAVMLWDVSGGGERRLGEHRGAVVGVEFFAAGEELLSCGYDGVIRTFGLTSGEQRELVLEEFACLLAASPTAPLIALAEGDRIELWSPRDGQRRTLAAAGGTQRLRFSPDGARLAALGDDNTVRVFEIGDGTETKFEDHEEQVRAAKFSPDGTVLATAGDDHTVRLWDLESGGSKVLRGHEAAVYRLAFSRSGKLLASAARDGSIRLWEVEGKEPIPVRELPGHPSRGVALAFCAKDELIATTSREELRLWSVGGDSRILHAGSSRGGRSGQQIAFSPDGSRLAAGGPGGVRVFDLTSSAAPTELTGITRAAMDLEFSPRGERIATVDAAGGVRVWKLGGEREVGGEELMGRALYHVAFAPNGRILAAPGNPNKVALWDLETGEASVLTGHEHWVSRVALSPDGATLASGDAGGELFFWDLSQEGSERRHEAHEGPIWSLAFDRRGETLLTAGADGRIKIWEVKRGRSRTIGEAESWVRHAALSGAGDRAAWIAGGKAWLWRGEKDTLELDAGGARELAFSADGRTLAASGAGREVLLWDTISGEKLALEGHLARVTDVAFAPDGRLASASSDGTVRLWPLDIPEEPAALRDWIRELLE